MRTKSLASTAIRAEARTRRQGVAAALGAVVLAPLALAAAPGIGAGPVAAADQDHLSVRVRRLNPDGSLGNAIGRIDFANQGRGLSIHVLLGALRPGQHGIHIHQNPNCGPTRKGGKVVPGGAAGGHYDPGKTGRHAGPLGNGHLGDLPRVTAGRGGTVNQRVFAPRLKLADIRGRAIIVHAGGDNYSDRPRPLGGGGARIACAVIK